MSESPQSHRNRQISGNTIEDGSGTEYRVVVDANGFLQISLGINLSYLTDSVQTRGNYSNAGVEQFNYSIQPAMVNTNQQVITQYSGAGVEQFGFSAIVPTLANTGLNPISPAVDAAVTAAMIHAYDGTTNQPLQADPQKNLKVSNHSQAGVEQFGLSAIGGMVNTDQQKATLLSQAGVEPEIVNATINHLMVRLTDGTLRARIQASIGDAQSSLQNVLSVAAHSYGFDPAGHQDRIRCVEGQMFTTPKDPTGIDIDKRSFGINLHCDDINALSQFHLVDISDTVNFPHSSGTKVIIRSLKININPDASFVGEFRLGYLANVDAANGDFKSLMTWHMDKKEEHIDQFLRYPAGLDGSDFVSNDDILNSPVYQTDVNLTPGITTAPSGDGDLIFFIDLSAGAVDIDICMEYDTE